VSVTGLFITQALFNVIQVMPAKMDLFHDGHVIGPGLRPWPPFTVVLPALPASERMSMPPRALVTLQFPIAFRSADLGGDRQGGRPWSGRDSILAANKPSTTLCDEPHPHGKCDYMNRGCAFLTAVADGDWIRWVLLSAQK
jgi:hypothetical protein